MIGRQTVVYTGPIESSHVAEEILGGLFDVVVVEPTPDSLEPALEGSVALLDASMRVAVTADLIARSPGLRVVSTATTGASHIDADALERRGIPLLTLKGQKELLRDLTPAAEHSWLLLLACARRLRSAIRHVEGGGWDRTLFPGVMLKGSTIGIIGLGRIGGWMARYARAFDMRVLAFDPNVGGAPDGVKLVDLEVLLETSDFITMHVNLTPETAGMLYADLIGRMKPGAVFVNTSRSELTDEFALVDALESGRLSAVGVDVLVGEPDPSASPLWRYSREHDTVVITPHVGGLSPQAVDVVVAFAARRILECLTSS